MTQRILLTTLAFSLLSSCGMMGLPSRLDRAVEASTDPAPHQQESSEFVTVDGVPMTVSMNEGRSVARVRAEPGTASIAMMAQATQDATGCSATPAAQGEAMEGIGLDQPLDRTVMQQFGGAPQFLLSC